MTTKVKLLRQLDGKEAGALVEYPDADARRLEKRGIVKIIAGKSRREKEGALRDDGPTVAEYVAAGYLAANYPPKGYASRSTPEEIAEAVAKQGEKAAPPPQNKMAPAPQNKAGTSPATKGS